MKIGKIMLQMSGIDLASLKEQDILDHIAEQCDVEGSEIQEGEIDIYINIEGTAVTAYYICGEKSGAVRLN
ncbi:MAG TPA: hypothetical protein DCS67_10980 [Clostridiales bacterium UBA8960]|jgi:hypothetical protein|nr:hypothetical protein [Clostridiales bacterium UBA8960]